MSVGVRADLGETAVNLRTVWTLYAIRHKASRRYMPEVKRGYTYVEVTDWGGVPRLFGTRGGAATALTLYCKGQHKAETIGLTGVFDLHGGVETTVDVIPYTSRNRNDFEVVEMCLEEKD